MTAKGDVTGSHGRAADVSAHEHGQATEGLGRVIEFLETLVARELAGWPADWIGFHWPGYTYEHTLRVRNLASAMAREVRADEGAVEAAALLHDIGKPEGEPHAEIGAQRANEILLELGMGKEFRRSVCDMVRSHIIPGPSASIECRILSDADAIDACYGYVSIVRYVTIRAHRGLAIEQTIGASRAWLSRYEGLGGLVTGIGRSIAVGRFERMREFLDGLSRSLEDGGEDDPAVRIVKYLSADAHRPSLVRQVARMEKILGDDLSADGLEPSSALHTFVERLKAEMVGER